MQRYLLLIDDLSTWAGKVFSWCILILTAVTCYDVVLRYGFSAPTGWAYDTEYILYGTLFMMAGAYTLSQDAHVRGDFIARLLPLLYSGYDFFHISWLQNEHSASSPTGPPIYPFKAIIPLAAVFMLLQGTVEVIRVVIALRTGETPKRRRDVEELEKLILEEAKEGKTADEILKDVEHHGEKR